MIESGTCYTIMFDDGVDKFMVVNKRPLKLSSKPSHKFLFLSDTSAKSALRRLQVSLQTRQKWSIHSLYGIIVESHNKNYFQEFTPQGFINGCVDERFYNPLNYKVVPIALEVK